MSRRLVNRARAIEEPSPAQRSRNRDSEPSHEPAPLPDYEPPTCALTPAAKRALDELHRKHSTDKYKKHLDGSIKALTHSIGDSNERLRLRKEALEKAKERRARAGGDENDGGAIAELEKFHNGMNTSVKSMTTKAEKALRDLIDHSDELAMKDTIMAEITQNVAAAPAPRPARRQRRQGSDEEENGEDDNAEEDEEEEEAVVVSALEILNKAKEDYAAAWTAKSLRARYVFVLYQAILMLTHMTQIRDE